MYRQLSQSELHEQNKMAEELYKLYLIRNVDKYNGVLKKVECVIKDERGVFKERLSLQSKDHIMEQVAFDIATLLGVKCCKNSCRKVNDTYGSFSRFEVLNPSIVTEFSKIAGKDTLHIEELLQLTISLTKNNINNFVIELYQFLLFDYLMGQQDRHLENLAVTKDSKGIIRWYPLYDNGICCFSTDSNDIAIDRLNKGFYYSRMGSSQEIYETLYNYRNTIYNSDIRKIMSYNKLNYTVISDIINKADKYKQLNNERRHATVQFIMNQAMDIHKLNLRMVNI